MNKSILIFIVVITNSLFAQKDTVFVESDTILRQKVQTIQNEFEKLKNDHKQFEYQKNFFAQALDSQNTIYSVNTTLFSVIVTIIFGLIAFIAYWQITSKFDNQKKELEHKYNLLFKEHEDIKLELHQEKGNVYVTHMNLVEEKEEKFRFILLATIEFLFANVYETSLEKAKRSKALFDDLVIEKKKYEEETEYDNVLNLLVEVIQINKESIENSHNSEIASIFNEIITKFSILKP